MKKILISLFLVVALAFTTGLAAAQETNSGEPATAPQPLPEATPSADALTTAGIIGTGPPPGAIGSYAMTPVPTPGAPACTGQQPPLGTPLGPLGVAPVDTSMARCIGSGWLTWSHGYMGDVYFTGGPTAQTLTMPPGTGAFYLYVEPDPFDLFDCQATAFPSGATTGLFSVHGSAGAVGVSFEAAPGQAIASIEVTCPVGFATGEYGISPGGPGGSVGGSVTGESGIWAWCKNQTTGETSFKILGGGDSWDCDFPSGVSPGDKILQMSVGTAN